MKRRTLLKLAAGSAALSGLSPVSLVVAAPLKELRLDYAYYSPTSLVLRRFGWLEEEFKADGVQVRWVLSAGSNRALEYLNANSIDIGSSAGLAALLAKANGNPIKTPYIFSRPEWTALVVRKDSPIRSVADLKGKKVAVTKAAGSHYLLIAALDKAGLRFKDIEPAYLTPADGRAAFERGSVAAWVTWDPYLAGVQRQSQVRILADGRGIADYQRYYLASSAYAAAHPEVLGVVFEALRKAGKWVKQSPKEAAELLAPAWGLDAATVELANGRRSYEVRPVVKEALGEQQKIADAFYGEGLLPRKLDATAVPLWRPR